MWLAGFSPQYQEKKKNAEENLVKGKSLQMSGTEGHSGLLGSGLKVKRNETKEGKINQEPRNHPTPLSLQNSHTKPM